MTAPTHTVTNQAPPLVGYDVYSTDTALTEAVARHADPALLPEIGEELSLLGTAAGSTQAQTWGEEANKHSPCCAPTTVTATASTRSTSTRRGTGCSATPSRRA